jgi:hypothetical protein
MGIARTWFFYISIPMGPQFYHEGITKSKSIIIHTPSQHDWSIVCNTFIFFFCRHCDKNYLEKKNKTKLCNICTWSINCLLDFFSCFTKYPNVGHKICIFDDKQKLTKIVLNLFKIKRKIKGITKLIVKKKKDKII